MFGVAGYWTVGFLFAAKKIVMEKTASVHSSQNELVFSISTDPELHIKEYISEKLVASVKNFAGYPAFG